MSSVCGAFVVKFVAAGYQPGKSKEQQASMTKSESRYISSSLYPYMQPVRVRQYKNHCKT